MSFPAGPNSENARTQSETTIYEPGSQSDLCWDQLEVEVLREMAAAYRDGPVRAEDWIERHPEISRQPELAVRVIYEEVCLREDRGERVDFEEIFGRFPQWHDALKVLLDCHRLVQPEHAPALFPQAGEQLGEFQLLYEIDRGAVGRVFLATQPALSDRPLVVKLTPRGGKEHLSLARLQHTHIVPLYLVQDFPAENIRALCMPYLGGTSWGHLLESMKTRPPGQRSGREIVELLAVTTDTAPTLPNFVGPGLRFLSRATYLQSVCWIGSCLADALHYAHQRGLVHLDIKPSNVLLAGDGQPMLLDFHLALAEVPSDSGPIERLGGTRAYMSPEQQMAAKAVQEGRPLSIGLDGRSDIYSLGVLLYESLSGLLPAADEATSRRKLRQANPDVSRGLEDVLHKCLARHPGFRYSDAGELAADLRRHLADLPLAGVPNRSLKERWQKWRRRKPHALAFLATALIALTVTGGLGLLFVGDRLRQADLALAQGQQHLVGRDYGLAIEQLESGWDAIRWFPGQNDLKQAFQNKIALAKRARFADALHQLVERLRFVDRFDAVPAAKLRELDNGCAKVWEVRHQIAQPDSTALNDETERRVRMDLLDLAVLWSELRMHVAPPEKNAQTRLEVLALLNDAQALSGPSPILELARRQYSTDAGDESSRVDSRFTLAPQTAWEHFSTGRLLFRSEQWEPARAELQEAIHLEPNAFWPNFYLTLVEYRLEHFDAALTSASVCVALSPESAECFHNRALAQQALGHRDQAFSDLNRALQLDPTLAVVRLHRGILLAEMQRYTEATTDLEAALAGGADPAAVHYQLALVQVAQQDRTGAFQSLQRALENDASYAPAQSLKNHLEQHP